MLEASSRQVAGGHLGHLLAGGGAIVAAIVVAVIASVRDRRRLARLAAAPERQPPAAPPSHETLAAPAGPSGWLAVAVSGAATVHGAVIRPQFDRASVLGWFFVALTVAEFSFAILVALRPRRRLVQAGLAANAAVVALWLYTRLVGIPFGVAGGVVDPVRVPDLLATGFGLLAIALAVTALRSATGWPDRPSLSPAQRVGAACTIALSAAIVSTAGRG